jgi:hypothetical protein
MQRVILRGIFQLEQKLVSNWRTKMKLENRFLTVMILGFGSISTGSAAAAQQQNVCQGQQYGAQMDNVARGVHDSYLGQISAFEACISNDSSLGRLMNCAANNPCECESELARQDFAPLADCINHKIGYRIVDKETLRARFAPIVQNRDTGFGTSLMLANILWSQSQMRQLVTKTLHAGESAVRKSPYRPDGNTVWIVCERPSPGAAQCQQQQQSPTSGIDVETLCTEGSALVGNEYFVCKI